LELEQAARVPLPGLAIEKYGEDSVSQKRRTLDLLLTFVILFHQEEQALALQDLRLKGPMLTGLTKLFHQITTGSTTLPAKFIESYLLRAIARAENGEGTALLKAFQQQLRLLKTMHSDHLRDDGKLREILFTCCDTLATEDNSVSLPSASLSSLSKGGGRRVGETNLARQEWPEYEEYMEGYTAMAETEQKRNYQADRGRDRRPQQNNKEKWNSKEKAENFSRKYCAPPCACCGAKDHPMLSPIRTSDGALLDSEYVCPAAQHMKWSEQKQKRDTQKFQPDPMRFAEMHKRDAKRVHEALVEFERVGSGSYRQPMERAKFRLEVLKHCNAPSNKSEYPQRSKAVGFSTGVEECHSSCIWHVNEDRNIEEGPPIVENGSATEAAERTIVLAFQANGITTTPHSISYSALNLLMATNIEPASNREIEAARRGDLEQIITKEIEDSVNTEEGGRGGKIKFEMPYGAEYLVPYSGICGQILADTGSTSTLIKKEFAIKQGLEIFTTGKELRLRDVNNGISDLTDYCFLRLTLTTILGERVTIVTLAHCVNGLNYDLLLGTKDLERYQLSILPHRGEAHMQIGNTVEIFPMLDSLQIRLLQAGLSRKGKDGC